MLEKGGIVRRTLIAKTYPSQTQFSSYTRRRRGNKDESLLGAVGAAIAAAPTRDNIRRIELDCRSTISLSLTLMNQSSALVALQLLEARRHSASHGLEAVPMCMMDSYIQYKEAALPFCMAPLNGVNGYGTF